MLNLDNFIALRNFIAEGETTLDMSTYIDRDGDGMKISEAVHCGTAACIAGHAVALSHPNGIVHSTKEYIEEDEFSYDICGLAAEWLGFDDYNDALYLFMRHDWPAWAEVKARGVGEFEAVIELLDLWIESEGESGNLYS